MQPQSLFKITAIFLAVSGIINIFVDFLPDNIEFVKNTLNFLAASCGLWGFMGLYLKRRAELGILGFVFFAIFISGLLLVISFLFSNAFVFPFLPDGLFDVLVEGTTGGVIFGSILLYVFGLLLFALFSIIRKVYPRHWMGLYLFGSLITPAALFVPDLLVTIMEIIASVGILGLSKYLWDNSDAEMV